MTTAARDAFRLAFQASPIILTRGLATALGGALPIIALTQGGSFTVGLLTGSPTLSLDSLFANFSVAPGSRLIRNQVATYPFANQNVAANAIIAEGLNVSLIMTCPARDTIGYAVKLATMIALQNTLTQHIALGGTFSVITPAYIYTDCLLVDLHDVSGGDSKQPQYQWQWDFYQPLVSLQAATAAQNGLMQTLSNGTAISGTPSWSSAGLPVGNPTSLLSSSIVPPGTQ